MRCLFAANTCKLVRTSLVAGLRVLVWEGREVFWNMWRRCLHRHNIMSTHLAQQSYCNVSIFAYLSSDEQSRRRDLSSIVCK